MIAPKDYYYKNFRGQFEEFVRKSNAHEHPGEGTYISIQELNADNLSHIPQDEKMLFYCALACTILIDQVVYTHFKEDYPEFQKMTLYPKIEYGITNINVNPWQIVMRGSGFTIFERFAEFFVEDLKQFFAKNKFEKASWDNVKNAILNDPDIVGGSYGRVFKRVLETK